MGNVTQINVEGRNYNLVAGQAAKGACTTSAAAYEKVVVLPDSTDIVVGMLVAVTFVNGNTAGFSGKKTIYSSDGTNFYWDSNLTDPVVLPPEGCYIIENISGQEYEYQAFPVLSVNGEVLPLCNSKGHPTGGPLWNAGDVVTFLYLEDRFIAILAEEGTDIKVYPTLADAQADLNNLSEGDIVGTEQGGDGAVDAVIAGDMRLVTSNAVAQAIAHGIKNKFTQSKSAASGTNTSSITWNCIESYDGTKVCWGRATSQRTASPTGQIYYSGGNDEQWYYPDNFFTATPTCIMEASSDSAWIWASTQGAGADKTKTKKVCPSCAGNFGTITIQYDIVAFGK